MGIAKEIPLGECGDAQWSRLEDYWLPRIGEAWWTLGKESFHCIDENYLNEVYLSGETDVPNTFSSVTFFLDNC